MGIRWGSLLGACALAGACTTGNGGANGSAGETGAVDSVGQGTSGATGGTGGPMLDVGAGLFDLGGDDSAGGQPTGCNTDPPPGYMIPTDPTCHTDPQIGMFDPVVEWTKSEWSVNSGSRQSVTTPIVAQLNDDNSDGTIDENDIPDVAYVTYDNGGMLRAMSGDGIEEVLSVSVPAFGRSTSIAAADIDNDGVVEIVGIDGGPRVVVFENDGTVKWTSANLGGNVSGADDGAAISDIDGDGVPEIVAGRAILDNAGNILATGTHGTGSSGGNGSTSFAVDLDDDGTQEVVVGNAVYRPDGSDVWYNGESDGFPAVADLDGDGVPEIVVVHSGTLRAQASTDGTVLWTSNIPGGSGGPPTVADFDGDGQAEVGIAGASKYTVFEGDGTPLWTNITQDLSSGITGSSVFDFEGDGVADVVYADETTLWVFSGNDGTVKLQFQDHSSGTRLEYPVIGDIDHDGSAEIAFVNEHYQGDYRGLTVVGDANNSWQAGRQLWNQYAYHITNVNDDGTIPKHAALNWKTYNNFRSGDLSPPDGLATPAVQLFAPDPCTKECLNGLRTVFVQVGNPGAAILSTNTDVEVYGSFDSGPEMLLDTLSFDGPLTAGDVSEGIPYEVDPTEIDTLRFHAVPSEIVCNTTDAQVSVPVPPCPQAPPPQG